MWVFGRFFGLGKLLLDMLSMQKDIKTLIIVAQNVCDVKSSLKYAEWNKPK
jgi:hypothetical protein